MSASSTLTRICLDQPSEAYPLAKDVGLLFPIEGEIGRFELLLSASGESELTVELWDTGRAENYIPATLRHSVKVKVSTGERQWVEIPLVQGSDEAAKNAFLIVRANDRVSLFKSAVPLTGVLSFESMHTEHSSRDDDERYTPVTEWSMKRLVREPFCFSAATGAYAASKANDGYARPFGGPHIWVSEPLKAGVDEWIEVDLIEATNVSEIHVTFNDDVNEDLINLHHHETPFLVIPELVKDYRIEAWANNGWTVLHREINNRTRKRVHSINGVQTNKLRLVVESTNGSPRAEIVEIRVYSCK